MLVFPLLPMLRVCARTFGRPNCVEDGPTNSLQCQPNGLKDRIRSVIRLSTGSLILGSVRRITSRMAGFQTQLPSNLPFLHRLLAHPPFQNWPFTKCQPLFFMIDPTLTPWLTPSLNHCQTPLSFRIHSQNVWIFRHLRSNTRRLMRHALMWVSKYYRA